jgi:hypothetical protein
MRLPAASGCAGMAGAAQLREAGRLGGLDDGLAWRWAQALSCRVRGAHAASFSVDKY